MPFGVTVAGLVNTPTFGRYSSTLTTYDTADAAVDSAVTQMIDILSAAKSAVVGVDVEPTLTFAVAGRATSCNGQTPDVFASSSSATAVNLGNLNATMSVGGAQDLDVTSNADDGFTVYLRGTATSGQPDLRAAVHTMADVAAGGTPAAGSEAFGYTASDVQATNVFEPITHMNASVLTDTAATASGCVGFQVAVATTTEAGTYNAVVIYTAVPTY